MKGLQVRGETAQTITRQFYVTLLVLCIIVMSSLFIVPVNASSTIIVPQNYPNIQDAVNAASPGDTILVKAGTYFENLIITKPITLSGVDKQNCIISGNGQSSVIEISTNNVILKDLTITNGGNTSGVFINFPEANADILNCIFSFCNNGIDLRGDNCRIIGNTIKNCSGSFSIDGTNIIVKDNQIMLASMFVYEHSQNVTITGNILSFDNSNGLNCGSYKNILIQNNTIISYFNTSQPVHIRGIIVGVWGQEVSPSYNFLIENNTINGPSSNIGPHDAQGITILASNVTVRWNKISFGSNAIDLRSDYNFISENIIDSPGSGMILANASHNQIVGNNVTSNVGASIWLFSSSSYNLIYRNNFTSAWGYLTMAEVDGSSVGNSWDNGQNSGGNYWYGYPVPDVNGDGYADRALALDSSGLNIDHYPLQPYIQGSGSSSDFFPPTLPSGSIFIKSITSEAAITNGVVTVSLFGATSAIAVVVSGIIKPPELLKAPRDISKKVIEGALEKKIKKDELIEESKIPFISIQEIGTLFVTILVMTFVMACVNASIIKNPFNMFENYYIYKQFFNLDMMLPYIFSAFISVVIVQTTGLLATSIAAHVAGAKKKYYTWKTGAVIYALTGLLFMLPSSSTTSTVYSKALYEIEAKKTKGLMTLSKTLLISTLLVIFAVLTMTRNISIYEVGKGGILLVLILLLSSFIPLKYLPGKDIYSFSPSVSISGVLSALVLLFLFLDRAVPLWCFGIVGIVTAVFAVISLKLLRKNPVFGSPLSELV